MLIAACLSGVWYARAAYHRSNPVFPFFAQWLGGESAPAERDSKTPLQWRVADLAASPWHVTMRPERFGGRGHQLGPLFLAILPAAFLSPSRRKGLGTLLAIAVVYWLCWYALRQNMRFLFPLVPILAVAAACVVADLSRWPRAPRTLAVAVCALSIAVMAAPPLFRAHRYAPVALGFDSRERFLQRQEPTYRAASFINMHLPAHARILSQEQRAFYFQREMTRENIFRRLTSYHQHLSSPAELVQTLRTAGFTHVLLAESDGSGIRYNGTLAGLADAALCYEPPLLRTMLRYTHHDADGTRSYRVLEILPAEH